MPNSAYCCTRSNSSYDLGELGQPFKAGVDFDNATSSTVYVHLYVSSHGNQTAIAVGPASTGTVEFDLTFIADTSGVTMVARLRDTSNPDPGVGSTLAQDADQTGIAFYGLGP